MTTACLAFALLSLLCAGINDFLFRVGMVAGCRSGRLLAVIGLVWVVAAGSVAGMALFHPAAILWGLASGTAGAAANLGLLAALKRAPAATCATIYRLNLIPAALVAVLLLDERLSTGGVLGLTFAGIAVAVLWQGSSHTTAITLTAAAAIARAAMGLLLKEGAADGASSAALVAWSGSMWVTGGLLFDLTAPREPAQRSALGFGLLCGAVTLGTMLFLTEALRLGPASLVLPISQMSFMATMLLVWWRLGERPSRRQRAAIALAVAALMSLGMLT
jgi:drug/metabolite transporter (DMT)-like permease